MNFRSLPDFFQLVNHDFFKSGGGLVLKTLLGPLWTVCRHNNVRWAKFRILFSKQKRLESSADGYTAHFVFLGAGSYSTPLVQQNQFVTAPLQRWPPRITINDD